MDELHRRGEPGVMFALVTALSGGGQREQGTDALSARLHQMGGDLRDPRRVLALHTLADEVIDRYHVVCKHRLQALDRRFYALWRIHFRKLSTQGHTDPNVRKMRDILRTTDPTVIAFGSALLRAEGIDCFVLDVHMSVLEGSIGVLPRRLVVADRDAFRARAILSDNELEVLPPP